MHIDFSVSIGNILTYIAIVGFAIRFETIIHKFLIEHEMLVQDYCKRNHLQMRELPTRSR